MALRPTIHKATVDIGDLDRSYYAEHVLTLARHPSETDERMMIRLLAFVLHADPALEFGAGLSASDEPDLWIKDLTGAIRLWIDVGQPDPKVTRKASRRSAKTLVLAYGRGIDPWWNRHQREFRELTDTQVFMVDPDTSMRLASLAARNMSLHALIQDGTVTLSDASSSVNITPAGLHP